MDRMSHKKNRPPRMREEADFMDGRLRLFDVQRTAGDAGQSRQGRAPHRWPHHVAIGQSLADRIQNGRHHRGNGRSLMSEHFQRERDD